MNAAQQVLFGDDAIPSSINEHLALCRGLVGNAAPGSREAKRILLLLVSAPTPDPLVYEYVCAHLGTFLTDWLVTCAISEPTLSMMAYLLGLVLGPGVKVEVLPRTTKPRSEWEWNRHLAERHVWCQVLPFKALLIWQHPDLASRRVWTRTQASRPFPQTPPEPDANLDLEPLAEELVGYAQILADNDMAPEWHARWRLVCP